MKVFRIEKVSGTTGKIVGQHQVVTNHSLEEVEEKYALNQKEVERGNSLSVRETSLGEIGSPNGLVTTQVTIWA